MDLLDILFGTSVFDEVNTEEEEPPSQPNPEPEEIQD